MSHVMARRRPLVCLLALGAALAICSGAWAHASLSPPVALAEADQLFTLAVPTEKEDATTTQVELTPPAGFEIDSFAPAPGWKREVAQSGSGENAEVERVTWSGGNVPTEEDAVFQFIGAPGSSKTFEFTVRQTYSDGSVVDWSGPESSDTPAPRIEAVDSLAGGGDGSSTLEIVALVVAAVALVAAIVAIVAGAGRRSLT
jgi:uncharacterized protein YcnI